jgi:hypothetical protein
MSLSPWTWSPLRTLTSLRTPRGTGSAAARDARTARRRQRADRLAAFNERHCTEALEPRTLLTTIISNAGQADTIFEYSPAPGTYVRMRFSGNLQAEILGASVSGLDNRARIGNLPGNLSGPNVPPTDIAGGIGGPGGIDIIGPVNSQATGNADINALAAHPTTGEMFAFDIESIPIQNPPPGAPNFITNVFLIQLSFPSNPPGGPYGPGPGALVGVQGAVVADLTAALQGGGQFAPVTISVAAADFDPISGLLYFVTRSGDDGIDQMWTIDVGAANIPGSLNLIPGFFQDPGEDGIAVSGLTFDQTGPGTAQLIAAIGEDPGAQGGGGGGGGGAGQQQPPVVTADSNFFIVNPNNTNFLQGIPSFIPGQQEGPTVGGIQTLADDPNAVDNIVVIGNNSHWELLRGNNGLLLDLGPLTEPPTPPWLPQPPPTWIRTAAGASGIMFVPTIVDPFSQQPGAYIGFDAATDRLFFVNVFESGNPNVGTSLYQIYVASADETAQIVIGQFSPAGTRPITPASGDAVINPSATGGNILRVTQAQSGESNTFTITPPTGTGVVFVGAVTRDINPNDPFEDARPLLTALVPPGAGLGLLPASSLAIDPATGLRLVPAGVTVNGDVDRIMIDGTVTGDVVATVTNNSGGSGSINHFYAGWLITGQANGELQGVGPTRPQNFRVRGDLRDLYVLSSAGTQEVVGAGAVTAPTYVTGFDLSVGGTLGGVKVGSSAARNDAWLGNFRVVNHPDEDATRGLDVPQSEIEWRVAPDASGWDLNQFSNIGFFDNDTFDTPQYLGSIAALGQQDVVQLQGTLQHSQLLQANEDFVDFYAVGLLAAQTVQVQLVTSFVGLPYVGVYDPDGRLIATDQSDVQTAFGTNGFGTTFGFTTDRPGAYRIAIAMPLNYAFQAALVDPTSVIAPYELRMTGVGDIAVGGINAIQNMLDVGPPNALGASYTVEFGDLGDLRAGNSVLSIDPSLTSTATVRVNTGSLRSLDGGQIGFLNGAQLNAPVQVDVPSGSVGLVRARSAAGCLLFNISGSLNGRPSIGGNYQVIDAHGIAEVELITDKGIGVMRALSMATTTPSIFTANFDNTGNDGIIDLIDCQGDFGTLAAGGPWISTNTGGNVRYIRVGGAAFTDIEFGGGFGLPIGETYTAGVPITLKDDSGSNIQFTAIPVRSLTVTDGTATETVQVSNPLNVRTYAIRGSGGVVVMDINTGDSITVTGTGNRADATGEIGRINMGSNNPAAGVVLDMSAGGPVFPDPTNFQTGFEPINPGFGGDLGEPDYRRAPNPLILQPLPGTPGGGPAITPGQLTTSLAKQDVEVIINGSSTVDVWDINIGDAITGPWAAFDGRFSLIRNDTLNGELPNIRAASVGDIVSRGTIGMARSHVVPGLALNPLSYYEDFNSATDEGNFPGSVGSGDSVGNTGYGNYYPADMGQFPTIDVRYGVWIYGDLDENQGAVDQATTLTTGNYAVPGNVRSIRAGQGVGNLIINGSIGELIANDGGSREPGVFAGINGIVWARGHAEGGFYNAPGRTGRPSYGNALQDRGGDIWFVDIGEGVSASGSGSAIRAGIYAGRHIDTIFGQDADIRGNIIAGDEWENARNFIPIVLQPLPDGTADPRLFLFEPNVLNFDDSIRRIELKNGSIINANIGHVGGMFASVEQSLRIQYFENPDEQDNPEFELGRVSVSGPNSGIIGTSFQGADIGVIDVNNGFGIFNVAALLPGNGVLGGVEADNYGIRNVLFNVGSSTNFLLAHGDGSSVSTARFSPSVRRSEGYGLNQVDPLSGMAPNPLTDLHAYLGTSAATPEIPGRTDTGIMENVDFRGQRRFGNLEAQQIRATNPDLLPSIINFANTFGTLSVRGDINGLRMTTGQLGSFRPTADVFNLDLTVAGTIKDLLIKGDLADGSVIRTQGPVGNMNNIRILGRLDGDVLASGKIKRLFVGENISGNISAARAGKGNAVGKLVIGGTIAEGGLNIQGNFGTFKVAGDFGVTGSNFSVTGKLGALKVGGNLFSSVHVGTTLGKLIVGGSIISGVTVEAQRIGSVRVGQDVQPEVTFRARKAPKIRTGGQMLGDVEILP